MTAPFRGEAGLTGHGRSALRRDALAIAAAALAAADPLAAFARDVRLDGERLWAGERVYDLSGRDLYLVGAGKATIGIAAALDDLLGERLTDAAVVVKYGQARPLRHVEVIEAAHPVPDENSLRGGERLLAIAAQARPEDLVLAVVTGGSSALAVAPAAGISLADKIAVNRLLLASGAGIVSINDVRKHLSRLKGGRLGAACGCAILNLSVSDVVGDPPDYFTDLTVPDRSTFAMAQAVCDRFGLWGELPAAVAAHLRRADPATETVATLPDAHTHVLADSAGMCVAAAGKARELGYEAALLTLELEGESAAAGRWLAHTVRERGPGAAVIAGGETTVTLGAGAPGRGGPSQEAAVAAALELHDGPPACALCLDSDGTDGPGDAAGGLVDDLTVAALVAAGRDAGEALARHDTGAALEAAGDLVVTGPTGTNVNDLRLALTAR